MTLNHYSLIIIKQFFDMQKTKIYSSNKYIELDSKLSKYPYLSKENLPNAIDAYIFKIIQQNQKIPDKSQYPHLFHWYVLLKQFARGTLQKWISSQELSEEEQILLQNVKEILKQSQYPQKEKKVQEKNANFNENIENSIGQSNEKIDINECKMKLIVRKNLQLKQCEEKLKFLKVHNIHVNKIKFIDMGDGTQQIQFAYQALLKDHARLKQQLKQWKDVLSYQTQIKNKRQ